MDKVNQVLQHFGYETGLPINRATLPDDKELTYRYWKVKEEESLSVILEDILCY
ncbi:hypothetical protein [Runella zeae]|uniref:hypothetical protein n=1 Tax=Runella zeae TaxID=94255 RepID=UPI002356B756|nr:hypothetical protein [Runella zeae]